MVPLRIKNVAVDEYVEEEEVKLNSTPVEMTDIFA